MIMFSKSNKTLSEELGQLLTYTTLSKQSEELLGTIAHRLQYIECAHITPIKSAIGIQTFEITNFQDNTLHYKGCTFIVDMIDFHMGGIKESEQYTDAPVSFKDRVFNRLQEVYNLNKDTFNFDFKHPDMYKVIIQYKDDLSDYRIIYIHPVHAGRFEAFMLTPANAYNFRINTPILQPGPIAEDFIFWSYNQAYCRINIDRNVKIDYEMFVINLAKYAQYTKVLHDGKQTSEEFKHD